MNDKAFTASAKIFADSARNMEAVVMRMEELVQHQNDMLDVLVDKIDKIVNNKKGVGTVVKDKLAGVAGLGGDIANKLAGAAKGFTDVLKNYVKYVPVKAEARFLNFVKSFDAVIDPKKALAYEGYAKAMAATGEWIGKLGKGLLWWVLVPDKMGEKVAKVITSITKAFKNTDIKRVEEGGKALTEMARGIFLFGLSLVVSTVLYAVGAIGTLVIVPVIALFAYMFNIIGKGAKEIDAGAKAIAWMGLAIFAFSGALMMAGQLAGGFAKYAEGAAIVALGIVVFAGLFYLVGNFAPEIEAGAKAMAWAGLGMLSIALGIMSFQLLKIDIKSVLVAGAAILLTGIAFGLIGMFATQIDAGSTAMILSGLAMLSIAIGIGAFKLFKIGADDVGVALLALVGIGVAMGLAGAAFIFVAGGAVAIALAGLALIILAAGLFFIGLVYEKAGKGILADSGQKGILGGSKSNLEVLIDGVVTGFLYAGLMSPVIILGGVAMIVAAAAMIVLSIGIIFMSGAYWVAQKFKLFDPHAIDPTSTNFEMMMNAITSGLVVGPLRLAGLYLSAPAWILAGAAMIVLSIGIMFMGIGYWAAQKSGIFSPSTIDKSKTNFEVMTDGISSGLIIGPLRLIGMYAAIPAWIMAGVALISIGAGLAAFAKLVKDGIDLKTIGKTVSDVLTTVASAFANIGKDAITGSKKVVDFKAAKKGIEAMQGIGNVLLGLAMGLEKMATLKFPTKWDKNGKPIEFMTLDETAFGKVTENIKNMVLGMAEALIQAGNQDKGGSGWFGLGQSAAEKGKIAIQSLAGGVLEDMSNMVSKFANLKGVDGKTVDFTPITEKIKLMIGAIVNGLIEAGNNAKIKDAQKASAAISDIGNGLLEINLLIGSMIDQKATENAIELAQQVITVIPQAIMEAYTKYMSGSNFYKAIAAFKAIASPIDIIVASVIKLRDAGNGKNSGFGEVVQYIERLAKVSSPITALANAFEKLATSIDKLGKLSEDGKALLNQMGTKKEQQQREDKVQENNSSASKEASTPAVKPSTVKTVDPPQIKTPAEKGPSAAQMSMDAMTDGFRSMQAQLARIEAALHEELKVKVTNQ